MVKILFAHAQKECIARDSSVIHHHVNVAKTGHYVFDELFSLLAARCVAAESSGLAVLAEFSFKRLAALDAAEVGEGNFCAFLREALATWILGDEPFVARLNPDLPGYGDYDQLMRLDEWQARGEAEQ